MTQDDEAIGFIRGRQLVFDRANALWRELKTIDKLSLARQVLARLHERGALIGAMPAAREVRGALCRQLALLTSKDLELAAATRHDAALEILAWEYDIDDAGLDGNAEVLGIAGGIRKRRWQDLGQLQDLKASAALYARGAGPDLGVDAYAHINAAFLDDLLAHLGEDGPARKARARQMRQRIVQELQPTESWFNTATRAEALFGLGRYDEATRVIESAIDRPKPWELRTTVAQLGQLAHMLEAAPTTVPAIRQFFEALLPGHADAASSAGMGKVGLALSGGGFRASFYHLGVLACLAEHDLLRHIEVLSCVSGGSIVGACYWMALRNRLMQPEAMDQGAYVALLKELIDHFKSAVDVNLRGETQPGKLQAVWRLLNDSQGPLEPEEVAKLLNQWFYQPLMAGRKDAPIFLDDLPFTPADHDPALAGPGDFNPGKHNWLRQHKVPALVLNATSVNTGHAWQFTTTWMGESPWSVHEATDSVARLEWAWYSDDASWRMELGRAVAASACVPGIFNPLKIDGKYADEVLVQLVDGGVHDNQGTVSLLAMDCNVVLVSDACGQLLFQKAPQPGLKGLASYVMRSMDVLMERVRNANFVDLQARKQSGQLRALMFLHMKAGLEPEVVPRLTSQQPHTVRRSPIAPSGLRRDFQRALAELRTDLNRFTDDEANALMACGYQMARHAVQRDLSQHSQLAQPARAAAWPFEEIRKEIASTAETTARRAELLEAFEEGKRVRM